MGLHPHEFENMQHRQSDQQARDSGSSDSGRKNPEMLEQSQQKWETLRKKKQLLHQEIQNKSIPEKLNTIHQWYETQRNEIPLDQNKIKKENNPEM
jgi:K+-transporting ATPase c subunit